MHLHLLVKEGGAGQCRAAWNQECHEQQHAVASQWISVRAVIECIGDRHPISGKVCCNVKRRPRGLRFHALLAIPPSLLTQTIPPRALTECRLARSPRSAG